jgi:hypothetical protein
MEAIGPTTVGTPDNQPSQINLPVKEFIAYDPKGTTTITGSPRLVPDATQADTLETKPTEEVKEESVTLSPQITALARKEAAQRQREQSLRQREKEMASKLADANKYAQLKAKIAAKDYSAAEELGMSYEEYTTHLLNRQNPANPESERQTRLEQEVQGLKKAQEESVVKEYQANQNLWKQEISKVINENEAFSTIKELKMEDAVLQHINDSFDEDDTALTVEQAAKDIEDALVARAEKFASVSKIKSRFSEPAKVLGPPKTSPKTLTQNMTVTSQQTKPKPFHLMTESEQIAEAIRRVQAAKNQR